MEGCHSQWCSQEGGGGGSEPCAVSVIRAGCPQWARPGGHSPVPPASAGESSREVDLCPVGASNKSLLACPPQQRSELLLLPSQQGTELPGDSVGRIWF